MDPITLISMLNMILTSIKNPDFVVTESQKKEINLIIDDLSDIKKLDVDNKTKKDSKIKNNNTEKSEKIIPDITLDKYAISNKGKDNTVTLTIVTKNEKGKIIPKQEVEIHKSEYGVLKSKKIKSNKKGVIEYKISIPESKIHSDESGIKIDIYTKDGFEWSKNIKTINYFETTKSNSTNVFNIKGR